MALFYLIRHGQPDYSGLESHGFFGFGRAFAPLSPQGIVQAEAAARDPRLKNAEFIVSSPYTRALQTAQIISRETGLPVVVDLDLHEWMPDRTNQLASGQESAAFGVFIPKDKPCAGSHWPICGSGCTALQIVMPIMTV